MKKILVSDYDRTLYQDENTTKKNLEAVARFRKKNIFAIATGRNYEDLMRAKQEYNIRCDYYLLNYGAEIRDHNLNLIESICLNQTELDKIEEFRVQNDVKTYYSKIDNQIVKVIIEYSDKNKLIKDYNFTKDKLKLNVFMLKNHLHLEIISEGVNKAHAIRTIENLEKTTEVYVIGDSENDLDMIKAYKGYCVTNANSIVKKYATREYKTVEALIDELMEAA